MEKEIKKPIGNPNDWHIEVTPKRAGDFGSCSISSIQYDTKEAESLAKEMIDEIKRHVDRVSSCSMVYESWICPDCKDYFETYEEAKNCKNTA